jgi:RimJ/RimL family protein N-acetyltransferase
MKNKSSQAELKLPFLIGKKLYLRILKKGDINDRYLSWVNDHEVVRFMRHRVFPTTAKALEEFIASRKWPGDLMLAIIDKKTDRHIGNIGLTSIDWVNRKAELGMLLGEKSFWNKGYMSESFQLMTDHAFQKMNLNKLYAGTEKDNKAAIALFKKMGWKTEGEFKQETYRDGRYIDVVRFAIFKKGA